MPIYNHPITIRLIPADVNSTNSSSTSWTLANSIRPQSNITSAVGYPFSLLLPTSNSTLPNIMINPKAFADPTNANPEIGVTYYQEYSGFGHGQGFGGVFINSPNAVANYPMDGISGPKTFSLLNHVGVFQQYNRGLCGGTGPGFNFIIHGQNDAVFGQTGPSGGQVYFEYSGVTGNTDAGFSRDFYKQGSSYVLFNSSNAGVEASLGRSNYFSAIVSATNTGQLNGWRKNFQQTFIGRFDENQLIGIDWRGITLGVSEIFLDALPGFDWNNVAGMSTGALFSINQMGYGQTRYGGYFEGGTANRVGTSPTALTSGSFSTPGYLYAFAGITTGSYNTSSAKFILASVGGGLPFVNAGSLFAPGKIVFNQTQDNATPYAPTGNRWVITPGTSLTLRQFNNFAIGDRNLFCGDFGPSVVTRLLPTLEGISSQSQNIRPGDYVQFTAGTGTASANIGIYQVINTHRGIPGDAASTRNMVPTSPVGNTFATSQYEALELSRGITIDSFGLGGLPQNTNITGMARIKGPVLHIKYT